MRENSNRLHTDEKSWNGTTQTSPRVSGSNILNHVTLKSEREQNDTTNQNVRTRGLSRSRRSLFADKPQHNDGATSSGMILNIATLYLQRVQSAFRYLAPQTACMSVHPIHPITKAITLTLEVQGLYAWALQGIKNYGRDIGQVDTHPRSAGFTMAYGSMGIVKCNQGRGRTGCYLCRGWM